MTKEGHQHFEGKSAEKILTTRMDTVLEFSLNTVFKNRRSQNFLWGALFSGKKLTTFFIDVPLKTHAKTTK